MEVRRYALDPVFGMLHDCPNMCGEPARMKRVEKEVEPRKDKFKCTDCGVMETKSYNSYTPFLSFRFSIGEST